MSLQSFLQIEVAAPGFGKAVSLGTLSVPLGWTTTVPEMQPDPPPDADDDAPPAPVGKRRGRVYQQALMTMVNGRWTTEPAEATLEI